ncbi:MAG TPA: hypothetical protein IGR89_07810 [Oscillatoriaceae cyanobacterium M7585_C2015_266]|nr:hypothetical protein [Oscillatoriaceae cyanobacterium M7585_C2015_266]
MNKKFEHPSIFFVFQGEFETHSIFVEIYYTEGEEGYYFAVCEHPFTFARIESELCNSPKEAFERIKKKIDFIYDELD